MPRRLRFLAILCVSIGLLAGCNSFLTLGMVNDRAAAQEQYAAAEGSEAMIALLADDAATEALAISHGLAIPLAFGFAIGGFGLLRRRRWARKVLIWTSFYAILATGIAGFLTYERIAPLIVESDPAAVESGFDPGQLALMATVMEAAMRLVVPVLTLFLMAWAYTKAWLAGWDVTGHDAWRAGSPPGWQPMPAPPWQLPPPPPAPWQAPAPPPPAPPPQAAPMSPQAPPPPAAPAPPSEGADVGKPPHRPRPDDQGGDYGGYSAWR